MLKMNREERKMKNILYCDKFLYQKIYMGFPKVDSKNQVIGSTMSIEEYNTYHILDKKYLNLCLNGLAGIKNIKSIIIQKSWYSDPMCVQISKYVHYLHPETKLIFYMDEGIQNHRYFLNKIFQDGYAYIAEDIISLRFLYEHDFLVSQDKYELPQLKRKELKYLINEYNNS